MATLTAARAAPTFPVPGMGGGGNLKSVYGSYTLLVNPTIGDILRFTRVPKGATVVGGLVSGGDIETAGPTLDIDIGWEANGNEVADPDGFGNLGTAVWTGNVVAGFKETIGILFPLQGVLMSAGPKLFLAETIISGTVIAAATTFVSGMITVRVDFLLP